MTLFGLERLPEILPVFPLTGTLLMPRGHLPLNIFESRYLDMVYYAREKNDLIGMVQPKISALQPGDGNDQFGTAPRNRPLFGTGCAGMISDLKENTDGSLVLLLTGLSRYDIIEEISAPHTFRQMRVAYDRFAGDCTATARSEDISRKRLILTVEKYLRLNNILPGWHIPDRTGDEELVNMLAMICPFSAAEKQAVLETVSLTGRSKLMLKMMEFDLSSDRQYPPDKTIQ